MKAIIGHIILNVKDFKQSELFYDRLLTELGFTIDHFDENNFVKVKSYRQNEHNIWIRFDKQNESKQFVRDAGLDHLAFQLKNEMEVDTAYELVKKSGVEITREPRNYPEYTEKYYAFYFRDPNGIPLEIYMQ